MAQTNCKQCGKAFMAERNKIQRVGSFCCSRSCRGILARSSQPRHNGRKAEHGGCVGGKLTRLYRIWSCMKQRCFNPNYHQWKYYGGKGIKMCMAWKMSFDSFRSWASSNGYKEDLQIDRINNNGGYKASNCRWVTALENIANRDITIIFPTGETTKQVADRLGMSPQAVRSRMRVLRLSPSEAASLPKMFGGKWKEL